MIKTFHTINLETSLNQCFFFPRENQKCQWKPFLPIFPIFFTRGKFFSRPLFRVFPVFFTCRRKIFTGGISRVAQFVFTGTILPPSGICFFGLFSPDQRMVIGCVYHFLHLFMYVSRTLQKYFHPFAYRLSAFFVVVVFSPVDQAVIGGVCNSLHFYTKI